MLKELNVFRVSRAMTPNTSRSSNYGVRPFTVTYLTNFSANIICITAKPLLTSFIVLPPGWILSAHLADMCPSDLSPLPLSPLNRSAASLWRAMTTCAASCPTTTSFVAWRRALRLSRSTSVKSTTPPAPWLPSFGCPREPTCRASQR